jgi:F like protein
VALAGADGQQAAELLRSSVKQGAAILGALTEAAVKRLLANPATARSAKRLFTDDEREQLADALAAVNATAELLGRTRIRKRLEQAEKADGGPLGVLKAHEETGRIDSEYPAVPRGAQEPQGAGLNPAAAIFPDDPTDFSVFDDSNPIHPLAPLRALDWFRRLIPGLFPRADDTAFAGAHERQGFTLAVTTDETLLSRIQDIIARALATGEQVRATPKVIDSVLEQAGVAPKNPQYAEMVMRTNMMSAYSAGSTQEMQDPDVRDSFPVWRYVGIRDGRQGSDHEPHFDKYYPNRLSFEEVRGDRPWNCRCTSIPVFHKAWKRLQANGATLART